MKMLPETRYKEIPKVYTQNQEDIDMLWFQKKSEEASEVSSNIINYAAAPEEPEKPDAEETLGRQSCLNHVQDTMVSNGKGVMLKLYIENFKQLNEIFGYDYCESLLSKIIEYLKKTIKRPVYRYIGVEFIAILDGYTQSQATALAEEILQPFDHVWKVDDTDCLCSAQIGLCYYPGYASTPQEIFKCLDAAITKASGLGPNQVVCYDTSLHTLVIRKQTIARYLKTALNNQEIEVRYRPTFHTATGRFTRAEYYMRIFIKGLGMIGANEFLPIAEDSGQIRAVEYFALNQTGRCIADLIAKGIEFDSISLPVSPVLFLQEDFLEEVGRVINTYHIPSGKLTLEIEESALTSASLAINTMMQELRDLGVELSLNNFVSGYSSITSILDLPINTLKLERSFMCQMETNPKSLYIVEGLIHIAKNLELSVIAEGVETQEQVDSLTKFECPYQQGFYFSPTVTEDVLMDVLGSTLEETWHIIPQEKALMRRCS